MLSENGRLLSSFYFKDELRSGTPEAIAALTSMGIPVEILSGDREEPVRRLASALDIPHVAQVSPGEKVAHIASVAAVGRKVLMVGDGLNDAPALVAAHISMAPASAADVGRNAADFVFLAGEPGSGAAGDRDRPPRQPSGPPEPVACRGL